MFMSTMKLWNQKNLEAPYVSSFKTSKHEITIEPLINIFKEASTFYSEQQFLEKEAALLSRCLYRSKSKLRTDKGIKELQKLNRALLQYLSMNFTYHVRNFYLMLPQDDDDSGEIVYLPTKNMLDYILVRLQGLLKLMCRAADCAKSAAFYLEQKMALGQFWKVAFICFGIASRLRVLAIEMIKFSWKFFQIAVNYSVLLKNTTQQWLKDDYVFAKNLRDYVCESCCREISLNSPTKQPNFSVEPLPQTTKTNQIKEESNMIEFRGFYIGDVLNTIANTNTSKKEKKDKPPANKGTKKEKRAKAKLFKKEMLAEAKLKQRNIMPELNTVKDLKNFLYSENALRDPSTKAKGYLSDLDKRQWSKTKKKLVKLFVKAKKTKDEFEIEQILEKVKEIIRESSCS